MPKEKKKRGRPKKKLQRGQGTNDREGEEVDDCQTLESIYEVKNEITGNTSDYLSELDSGILSTNADKGYEKETSDEQESDSLINTSTKEFAVRSMKEISKSGRPRKRHSKLSGEKHSVVPKRKGIANKLIKRAMREVRKESKAERRKRPAVFMCNFCLNKFNLNGLKEHLKEHCSISGEELKCNLCDKILMCGNRILNFNSHLR